MGPQVLTDDMYCSDVTILLLAKAHHIQQRKLPIGHKNETLALLVFANECKVLASLLTGK